MQNSFFKSCQDGTQTQNISSHSDNKDILKSNLSENYNLVRDLVILSKTDPEAKKLLNLVKVEIKNASLP
ncbi:hypothetical protein [Brevibacillus laterosporus]|uniref:Uncharacterized protein n=2 Tax=Brevibacillus laterosporus TaxID=1465 RepID=A0AAP3DD75_BRELA|nr:hypothetical protein [Brevibacillus laterosporus]MCR8978732.1 hypothetical protein [Brevibacillus laterosporus]MCZ0805888.1 hypothetical protein [Brevibacillus laterosporus]MCZ0824346.1 hypothetical protein [Brevibacillus laterosporus]